jgi:hypothetical protein
MRDAPAALAHARLAAQRLCGGAAAGKLRQRLRRRSHGDGTRARGRTASRERARERERATQARQAHAALASRRSTPSRWHEARTDGRALQTAFPLSWRIAHRTPRRRLLLFCNA